MTFREFGLEIELPWELILMDIPEPDPGKRKFHAPIKERPINRFCETSTITKLIEHLSAKN